MRASNRLLKARDHDMMNRHLLHEGREVFVWLATSANNVPNKWVRARVVKAYEHLVECRRSNHRRPMQVFYNDICLFPEGQLAANLMERSLEDILTEEVYPPEVYGEDGDDKSTDDDSSDGHILDIGQTKSLQRNKSTTKHTATSSFLSSAVVGDTMKDIGNTPPSEHY